MTKTRYPIESIGLLLAVAMPTRAEELVLVQHGQPQQVVQVGKSWIAGRGYLECGGRRSRLMARYALTGSDIQIKARLSIAPLGRTLASFIIDGQNQFGFGGADASFFVTGPLFGSTRRQFGYVPDHLEAGEPFDFEMRRTGEILQFLINGRKMYQLTDHRGGIGFFGLQPGQSKMRVYEFSASGNLGEPFRRVFRAETRSQIEFWWEGVPENVRKACLDTGMLSNVLPADYAGPASCMPCHRQNHQHWMAHAHRWMNAPAKPATVKGGFSPAANISFYGGKAMFSVEEDRYVMRLVRGPLKRTYHVTQTIGSRFFQYYVGVQIEGPEPKPHAIYDQEHLLPFGYWLDHQQWVPVVHVDGARQGESDPTDDMLRDPFANPRLLVYAQRCAHCHTTVPMGDLMLRHSDGFRRTPRISFAMSDYISEAHSQLLTSHDDPSRLSSEAIRKVWKQIANIKSPTWDVTSGISCEACHIGSKFHVENEDLLPKFFPVGRYVHTHVNDEADPLGRTKVNKNLMCGRCHAGKRPEYAAGMATWNSVEFDDAMKGGCYTGASGKTTLTCVDCHDPHQSIGEKWSSSPIDDDAKCLECHQEFEAPAQRAAHTHHSPESSGSRCMDCHMPRINEGLQDMVRTHTIFSPTNASMIEANQANACNMCHVDKSIDWTLEYLNSWYGKTYAEQKMAASYHSDYRSGPATVGWLHQWHAPTQMVAADALLRAKAIWALPELILMLDNEHMLNRQFALIGIERMLDIQLSDYGYRFYMLPQERRLPLERIWTDLVPGDRPFPLGDDRVALAHKAERELERSRGLLRANPDSARAHFRLANLLEKKQDVAQAIQYYEQAAQLKPDYSMAHFKLGYLYMQQGEHQQALSRYRTGLKHDPVYLPASNNLAWLLATSRDRSLRSGNEALRYAQHAAAADGHESFAILDTLAAAHAEVGQFENAIRWGTKAVQLAPAKYRDELTSRLQLYKESKPFRLGIGP